MTLAEEIAERILQAIVEGRLAPGQALPPEPQLAAEHGASRLTIREAVQILRSQNVVHIDRGRGTIVDPPSRWTSLSAVMRASAHAGLDEVEVAERLLEARRMIEIGAVELAAVRRTDGDLAALDAAIERMASAAGEDDLEAVVAADLDFHRGVLVASGNPFVPLLFDSFDDALVAARRRTSAVAEFREHGLAFHRRILAALRDGDVASAREAMVAHLSQTEDDLRVALRDRPPAT